MPLVSLIPVSAAPCSPLRPMALVAFAIFALGTTFYALGVTAWSGQRVASLDVQQERAVPLPGVTWTHMGPRAGGVGPVRLDPGMNPARVFAYIGYQPQPGRALSCRVTMRGPDGQAVWSENRTFATQPAGRSSQHNIGTTLLIETFDVPRAGDYTFAVDFGAGASRAIHSVRLDVRRQVASVQLWFVVTGALLALASLVVVLLAEPRPALLRGRRSLAA